MLIFSEHYNADARVLSGCCYVVAMFLDVLLVFTRHCDAVGCCGRLLRVFTVVFTATVCNVVNKMLLGDC